MSEGATPRLAGGGACLRALRLAAAALFLHAGAVGELAAAELDIVTIAGGRHGGVYLHTGRAICRFVNASRARHQLRCLARSSADPVSAVRALHEGERSYALVPSDVLYDAYAGRDRFADSGPWRNLRRVLALQDEPLVVLARAQSGVRRLEDLRGRRVNLGVEGGSDRELVEELLAALGLSDADLAPSASLDAERAVAALCAGELDAAFFRVDHPTGWAEEAIRRCGARLVPMTGPAVDTLIASDPSVVRAIIEGGTYPGEQADVPVIALETNLVTTADRPDDEVYEVASAVGENLQSLSRLHRSLDGLVQEDLVDTRLDIPLHPGAERYLREAGLVR
ncbi:MAG: TAXI family TRAP transporter solute-binding subunit [Gammaproteobacteria bacterium]|nr:TAXI family TRAP transporter solute-binding subunit [Gammaproteobacteria bacterium]